ncbi:radical SAM family heme chaperone HemW [Alkalilimnicola ehrlichii]|uniref:radical SAM family heme chaperone HemW n=1 Tax=Alkalilimnicola ehrlichii TaxID=351052 RepID=UPI003B9F795F
MNPQAGTPPPPLGVYLHLPWCVQKCPYCDFNSHAPARADRRADASTLPAIPHERYTRAVLTDLASAAGPLRGRRVETVFIGGGTPSLFPPEAIGGLLEALDRRLGLTGDAEITLEANPGTVEQGRFHGYRAAGVNRLSIGVQSFDAGALRRLGRIHGPEEARRAVRAARRAGFRRINLDLMYALPGQTTAQALADVEAALALAPEHISHYQLTLEPGTPFHSRPPADLPDEARLLALEAACRERLAAAGLTRYEVSTWAHPGEACRHNLNYWRFGDYLGLGAGAHGKLSDPARDEIRREARVRMPGTYMAQAGTPAAIAELRRLQNGDIVLEFMMNALRLAEGFHRDDWRRHTGRPTTLFEDRVAEAVTDGLLSDDGGRIRPTQRGWQLLDGLLQRFL